MWLIIACILEFWLLRKFNCKTDWKGMRLPLSPHAKTNAALPNTHSGNHMIPPLFPSYSFGYVTLPSSHGAITMVARLSWPGSCRCG
jgi:hypothetical protein